jgi:hypothetical protein
MCKIPPGHRVRIENFVRIIKIEQLPLKLTNNNTKLNTQIKRKHPNESSSVVINKKAKLLDCTNLSSVY